MYVNIDEGVSRKTRNKLFDIPKKYDSTDSVITVIWIHREIKYASETVIVGWDL